MLECSIFMKALDCQTDAERSALLDEACAHDPALRQRVEALLRSHALAGSFLSQPVGELLAEELELPLGTAETQPPKSDEADELVLEFLEPSDSLGSVGKLGHYEVQEVIGRGGMGVVLRAFDERLHRVVAIKVMAAQLATSATARKRFIREARAAAAISHDHIVTIHAVEEANGLPYIVMHYVAGQSLQEKIDYAGHLELKEILRIGQQIAAGLAAAHAHGLMHRDVKPANILLENGVERVRITDFGLARAVDDMGITCTGEVPGTPQYMSPEQAQGLPMDARSDLFSLGCVLYAMCTGRSPFRAETAFATARRVCEDTPRPLREVNPEIPLWLVEIIDRLLAKQAAERFQSAAEVAELLSRQLAEVQHPSTTGQSPATLEKSACPVASRPRPALWTAAAVLLCVALLLGLAEAGGVTKLTTSVIRVLTPQGTLIIEVDDPGVTVAIEGDGGLVITGAGPREVRLPAGKYKVRATKDGQPMKEEIVSISRGGKQTVSVTLEMPVIPVALTAAHYGPWVSLFNERDLTGWQSAQSPSRWLVENKTLISGDAPGYLFSERSDYRDFHLRAQIRINSGGNSGILVRTTLGPGIIRPGYEAQICADVAGQIKTGSIGKMPPWQPVAVVDSSAAAADTWFDLEIIARGPKIHVKVNGVATAEYSDAAFTHRSGRIALQHHDDRSRVEFRKIAIREEKPQADNDARRAVEPRAVLEGHRNWIESFAFSPDGETVASCGQDKRVRLWKVATGVQKGMFEADNHNISWVAYSPDGALLVTASLTSKVKVWNAATHEQLAEVKHDDWAWVVAFRKSDSQLATASRDKTVRLWKWDGKGLVPVRTLGEHSSGVSAMAYSPDGTKIATATEDGMLHLWDVESGEQLKSVRVGWQTLRGLAFSMDGATIATGGYGKRVELLQAATLESVGTLHGHRESVWSLAFLPGGKMLASGGGHFDFATISSYRPGELKVWDIASRQERLSLDGHDQGVRCVILSPDGKTLATGDFAGRGNLWNVADLLVAAGDTSRAKLNTTTPPAIAPNRPK